MQINKRLSPLRMPPPSLTALFTPSPACELFDIHVRDNARARAGYFTCTHIDASASRQGASHRELWVWDNMVYTLPQFKPSPVLGDVMGVQPMRG